jgi:hypothetical protein
LHLLTFVVLLDPMPFTDAQTGKAPLQPPASGSLAPNVLVFAFRHSQTPNPKFQKNCER